MSVITVDNNTYIRSHGKNPKGRGLWMFHFNVPNKALCYNGTLTEALKKAKSVAKELGATTVIVMP